MSGMGWTWSEQTRWSQTQDSHGRPVAVHGHHPDFEALGERVGTTRLQTLEGPSRGGHTEGCPASRPWRVGQPTHREGAQSLSPESDRQSLWGSANALPPILLPERQRSPSPRAAPTRAKSGTI